MFRFRLFSSTSSRHLLSPVFMISRLLSFRQEALVERLVAFFKCFIIIESKLFQVTLSIGQSLIVMIYRLSYSSFLNFPVTVAFCNTNFPDMEVKNCWPSCQPLLVELHTLTQRSQHLQSIVNFIITTVIFTSNNLTGMCSIQNTVP